MPLILYKTGQIFSKKTYLKMLCKLKEKSCSRHLTCNCMPKVDLRYVCQENLIVLAMLNYEKKNENIVQHFSRFT